MVPSFPSIADSAGDTALDQTKANEATKQQFAIGVHPIEPAKFGALGMG
jgi:hypothetical protein